MRLIKMMQQKEITMRETGKSDLLYSALKYKLLYQGLQQRSKN
jgi:hypothetical protein